MHLQDDREKQKDDGPGAADNNLLKAFNASVDALGFLLNAFVPHGADINVSINLGVYLVHGSHVSQSL